MIILACICMVAFLIGCPKNPTIVTLSEVPLKISVEPIVLKPEQPLLRSNKSLSIRIQIKEEWAPEAPWRGIRLQDGSMVIIKAVLISDTGAQYLPHVIGAGDGIDIRFNDSVPKDVQIVKIVLTSTHQLTAQHIKWVYWNPK
jgi:hypothetical protein